MRQDPFEGRSAVGGQRQGFRFNPRLLILLLFAGYAAYYWISNRSTDPYTGETVTINEAVTDVPRSAKFAEIGWKPN